MFCYCCASWTVPILSTVHAKSWKNLLPMLPYNGNAYVHIKFGRAKQKCVFEHEQNTQIQSHRACARSHQDNSPLVHSIVSNDSVS